MHDGRLLEQEHGGILLEQENGGILLEQEYGGLRPPSCKQDNPPNKDILLVQVYGGLRPPWLTKPELTIILSFATIICCFENFCFKKCSNRSDLLLIPTEMI